MSLREAWDSFLNLLSKSNVYSRNSTGDHELCPSTGPSRGLNFASLPGSSQTCRGCYRHCVFSALEVLYLAFSIASATVLLSCALMPSYAMCLDHDLKLLDLHSGRGLADPAGLWQLLVRLIPRLQRMSFKSSVRNVCCVMPPCGPQINRVAEIRALP